MYKAYYTSKAQKDAQKIKDSGLKTKTQKLLSIISDNPWQSYSPHEKLVGDLKEYSRNINIKHRLIYEVWEEEKYIKILRMWAHYD